MTDYLSINIFIVFHSSGFYIFHNITIRIKKRRRSKNIVVEKSRYYVSAEFNH